MDQPHDRIGVPFEPATDQARLRKIFRPMLRLIFHGTIAAGCASPGRSFAIGYVLRHLGQRPNGDSNASHPPSRDAGGFPCRQHERIYATSSCGAWLVLLEAEPALRRGACYLCAVL